jgi:hypothetical protein
MDNTNQNNISYDLHNISLESSYKQEIIEELLKSYHDSNFCDKFCLWWFFHSGTGLETHKQFCYVNIYKCICCSFCPWVCQCRFDNKICSIKLVECCCISCLCE